MKHTTTFSLSVPFSKTERINGRIQTTHCFDLIFSGTARLDATQDIDNSWDTEYSYDVETVEYMEFGHDRQPIAADFLWFADIQPEDMETNYVAYDCRKDGNHEPIPAKAYIQAHIQKLDFGMGKAATSWDDLYATLGNAFGDL